VEYIFHSTTFAIREEITTNCDIISGKEAAADVQPDQWLRV
jgi:hypothetical protein